MPPPESSNDNSSDHSTELQTATAKAVSKAQKSVYGDRKSPAESDVSFELISPSGSSDSDSSGSSDEDFEPVPHTMKTRSKAAGKKSKARSGKKGSRSRKGKRAGQRKPSGRALTTAQFRQLRKLLTKIERKLPR